MMNADRRRSAFTLIEVLIVVVIMAVLAATVIPQFTSSTKDAQTSTVEFNARTLRAQIELYKAHHNGDYPDLTKGANLSQLTTYTKADGSTSATKDAAYPFGPYVAEIPKNPFNNLSTVTGGELADGDGTTGWRYDKATGGIWPNNSEWKKPTAATTPTNP